MLVYESANPETGKNWYAGLAGAHPTVATRRAAAMLMAWPVMGSMMPNTGHPSYNAMATFWRDDAERVKKLAGALVNLKYLADQHVGQNLAVFTEGSPEPSSAEEGGLVLPVTMLIGRVARVGKGDTPVGRLEYKYAGRKAADDEDRSRAVPSLRLAVGVDVREGVQSLTIGEFGTSAVSTSKTAPDGSKSLDVLMGQVTFNEDPDEYARHRQLTELPIIIGNAAVHEFVSRLTIYDNGDARQNWRQLSPSPEEPLPDLSQIFTPAAAA